MAYVGVEDNTAAMEVLVFQRVLVECGGYIKVNSPVLVTGRISARDDKPPQLMCDNIRPLGALNGDIATPSEPESKKLYLKLPGENSEEFIKTKRVLNMFVGNTPVVLYFEDTKKKKGTACVLHEALLEELKTILGEKNVVVK
jgi:DNA polymerase-3 subunit alpha